MHPKNEPVERKTNLFPFVNYTEMNFTFEIWISGDTIQNSPSLGSNTTASDGITNNLLLE